MTAPIDQATLRAKQAPLKAQYKEDPASAQIWLKAAGRLDQPKVAIHVDTEAGVLEAGLHPATGGDGTQACSGDMLLQALVACSGVTLNAVATALGVTIAEGEVRAEGLTDFRGTLGVAKDAPVGFSEIRLIFDFASNATPEQLASLEKLTERYCVVYQTLKGGVPITSEFQSRALAA